MEEIKKIVSESNASLEKLDLEKILALSALYEPKVILEIGMWKGFSAENWIKAFDPDLLITLERDHKHEDGTYYAENTVEGKQKYHYLWDVDSNAETTVDKVKALLDGRQVDFLFIDGGHEYSVARRDIKNYLPLLKPGGIATFHDILYFSDACQVNPLWNELKKHYDTVEVNCGPGSTGFGFLVNNYQEKKIVHELHE